MRGMKLARCGHTFELRCASQRIIPRPRIKHPRSSPRGKSSDWMDVSRLHHSRPLDWLDSKRGGGLHLCYAWVCVVLWQGKLIVVVIHEKSLRQHSGEIGYYSQTCKASPTTPLDILDTLDVVGN